MFKGSFVKQKKAIITPPNILIVFIVYKLDTWSRDLNSNFTLNGCLFGGVKLAKNTILINTYIVLMVLDSIRVQNFHLFYSS